MLKLLPKIEFSLQSLFKSQDNCPYCNSRNLELAAKKYALVKVKHCIDCDLYFTSPLYSSSFVSEFYDVFYKAEGLTTSPPDLQLLESLKLNKFKGCDKDFSDRIKRIRSFCPGTKLLELGSSWGYFLYQASLEGFNVTGIELSDSRRTFGREHLSVNICKSFHELNGEIFDIIYTAHTLEHFLDLSTVFSDLAAVLSEGGYLIIEVPNFYNSSSGFALNFIGAIHPLGFGSDFFSRNLTKHGFEISGFYDSWEDFPNQKKRISSKEVILLLAKKSTGKPVI